ncbi:hypothetical protein CIK77_00075 [Microbacterium sp. JB110]|nr:hypothetical protein CIK77_00075 [Microbacterium sp. JB110]
MRCRRRTTRCPEPRSRRPGRSRPRTPPPRRLPRRSPQRGSPPSSTPGTAPPRCRRRCRRPGSNIRPARARRERRRT